MAEEPQADDERAIGEEDSKQNADVLDDFTNLREPTDQELFKALEKVPLPQGHKEMGRVIMPINIDEYWDMFQSQEALFNVETFF